MAEENLLACTHHWKIETPVPEVHTVAGTCIKCGQSKEFASYMSDEQWGTVVGSKKSSRFNRKIS